MPRTSRPLQVHAIVMRQAEVAAVTEITPNMRRLTLTGEELRAGTMGEGHPRPAFVSDGFDDHVKLVIPPTEGELPFLGTQEATSFRWNPEVFQYTRDYTVRNWDREAGTFDIDVVRHDHGVAAEWAFRAAPGDRLNFAGPKSCAPVNHDVDWHLLVGDETALPAIGRWLEEAPEGAPVQVLVEVPSEQDVQDIPTRADASIAWLVRGSTPAGQSSQLLEALRTTQLPEGRGYAWCAGEALTIAPIRRYLRQDFGMPKEDVEVVGYWRRPSVAATEDDAAQDTSMTVLHEVHEMTELLPPVVTRVAATLGIGSHVAAGATSTSALAAATGVDATRLQPLLDAMQALGLLTRTDGGLANTPHGAVLTEVDYIDELTLDNPVNRQVFALVDLLDVLRTGTPSPQVAGGVAGSSTDAAAARADRDADELYYILEPLGREPEIAGADRLAVTGAAADLVAPQILAASARPGRTLEVNPDPAACPPHDCAVLLAALEGRTREESVGLLKATLASGPAVAVVERVVDDAHHDDHAAEAALTSLVVTGQPARSSSELEQLLHEAGAARVETRQVGWGFGHFGTVILAHA